MSSSDQEIVSSRVFPTPRERVWAAWTDPALLARWWGPKGFRNTFHRFDLRPDGQWSFLMHGPDGRDYPNESIFREITPPTRLVFDHVCAPLFRVTATFAEAGTATLLTFRMTFVSAEVCAHVKSYVVPANEENFDRLEAVLAEA